MFKQLRQDSLRGIAVRHKLKIIVLASFLGLLLFGTSVTFAALSYYDGNTVAAMASLPISMAITPFVFSLPDSIKSELSDSDSKGLEVLANCITEYMKQFQTNTISAEKCGDLIGSQLEAFANKYSLTEKALSELQESIKQQGIAITNIQSGGKNEDIDWRKSLLQQLDKLKADGKFTNISKNDSFNLTIKAVSPITTASVSGGTAFFTQTFDGVQHAPNKSRWLLDILLKGTTTSGVINWVNRFPKEGGSDTQASEGVRKASMDVSWVQQAATPITVAVFTKVSTQMLSDSDYISSEIEDLIQTNLRNKVDDKLISGSGINDVLGFTTVASSYSGTTIDGTVINPNNAHAILALMLQIQLEHFRPDTVFINPQDNMSMKLAQAADGHSVFHELLPLLSNLTIVEDTDIPAGNICVMDSSVFKVYIKDTLNINMDTSGDDFINNLVTVLAEIRLFSYISNVNRPGIAYESLDTIKTALEKV